MIQYTSQSLPLILAFFIITTSLARSTVLMDSSGNGALKQIPSLSTSNGVVTIVSSPGTPSVLGSSTTDDNGVLSLVEQDGAPYTCLSCRGATLSSAISPSERTSLATTSVVAGSLVVDGITEGDIEMGLSSSRHGQTLAALFKARSAVVTEESSKQKQTLILAVIGGVSVGDVESTIQSEVKNIFLAATIGSNEVSFSDMYDVNVVSVQSEQDASQVMSMASEAAKLSAKDTTLSDLLSAAQTKIRETGVATEVLDTPDVAAAFLSCREAYAKRAQKARSKIAAWKSRAARGLVVDKFGAEAENLYKQTMGGYDTATLSSTGMSPAVSSYRLEMRNMLQSIVEFGLRSLYAKQVSNLEKLTMKKFEAQLLKRVNDPSAYDENAASLRSASLSFENAITALDTPSLGLTKERSILDMSSKLNDSLDKFPDSPVAQMKRMNQVKMVAQKDKKPSEPSLDLGLDLVAMIRPDGFGSFQGFVGYQLGGNSITVGCHNDADDPQTISQFGGVRPPLLRVQPKLRVDVEL